MNWREDTDCCFYRLIANLLSNCEISWKYSLPNVSQLTNMRSIDAGWSSSVARRAHNPKVVGSNPAPATKFKSHLIRWLFLYALFMFFLSKRIKSIFPLSTSFVFAWFFIKPYLTPCRKTLCKITPDRQYLLKKLFNRAQIFYYWHLSIVSGTRR